MECLQPITIKPSGYKEFIKVPCGQCYACRRNIQNSWYVRFLEQQKVTPFVNFVTLTYSDQNLPRNGVSKRDFQLFIKRYRKHYDNTSNIKYFACSEYGSHTFRPHYHALLFNDFSYHTKDDLEPIWKLGFVDSQPAKKGSMYYVTKYLYKKFIYTPEQYYDQNTNDWIPLNPTFSLKSTNLGANFKNCLSIITSDFQNLDVSYRLDGGTTVALPRYYKKYMLSQLPQELQNLQKEKTQQYMLDKFSLPNEEKYLRTYKTLDNYYPYMNNLINRQNETIKLKLLKNHE